MKKLLSVVFFLLLSIVSFSEYDFPYKNPNVATIFGSSALMIDGVSKNIPVKEYTIKLPWCKNVPKEFWYNEGFNFSLVPQKEKAPLVFLLAGTGSSHNSLRNELFQRILYDAGYNVISISSPMNSNFIINGSSSRMPGIIFNDSQDIYNIMKATYKKVHNKIKVSDFYVMGYSLGATEAAMVSYIDEEEKAFNFKRVFMINPAVNAYKSALKLDNYLDFPPEERAQRIADIIQHIINKVVKGSVPEHTVLDVETIFKIFSKSNMTNKEMQELIGGAFRVSSIDLNYITDRLSNRRLYQCNTKNCTMFDRFEKVNFASFDDYVNKIAFPYFKEKSDGDLTMEQLLEKAKLQYINDYLKNSSKIAVVTNQDELILDEEDLDYLKDTFKNRIIIYPYGGHCGNMFYTPNVKTMLHFLKEGELTNEN